ncbi:MAG: 30S ribosomal protein S12 methylthiotransferase RimO [Pseudomonadota bacterium]
MRRTIHFVSLGCAKNTVDTERMLALAIDQGLTPVSDPMDSDIILVNTCGFIEAAKQESIDTILELALHKQKGRCITLIMAGCMSQRYPTDLANELPEVDFFLGTADLPNLARILRGEDVSRVAVGHPNNLAEKEYERHVSGPIHTSYLKISEGCDRLCAFCAIPIMRGRQRSHTIPFLVKEAKKMIANGVKELVLVAQDTTAYGHDLIPKENLVGLLNALGEIDNSFWIRILYAYPSSITKDLATTIANLPQVVPYLDVPFQHIDDEVLKRMRRGYTETQVQEVLELLREEIPGVFLRTTLLCGHPGETKEAHEKLLDFLRKSQLDHVGVFPFSCEEDTPAAIQLDQVPIAVAHARANEAMSVQKEISKGKLCSLKGQIIEVLVEGLSSESEFLLQGRHVGQAPEIDGVVIMTDGFAQPGEIVRARVIETCDYDLVASIEV